jgi:VanZ family protein
MRYSPIFKLIFILCFTLLTYLLLIEMAPTTDGSLYKDKIQHVIAFGGVAFWGLLAFSQSPKATLFGLAVFGALMEVLQGILTTTRQPSVYDWLADVVGLLLAWGVAVMWQRWWSTRRGRI